AQADLDRDALCGAEFVIGHGATPYRNGRVLHSVFAAALLGSGKCASRPCMAMLHEITFAGLFEVEASLSKVSG
ncbi:hypothetical protein, partial [Pseudomonas aeruginosa]|uniref:hypothetical protein n=1 Tax=Pseudomonas aeruginosa TaxID=287 RepID=UPI001FF7FAA8